MSRPEGVNDHPEVLRPQPLQSERSKAIQVQIEKSYQGPIPPPDFLIEYSGAIENGGERVFAMIEAEANHVQSQERLIVNAQITLLKRGQLFAFAIAIAAMGGATWVAPHSVGVALAMVSVGVGTLAVAFLNRDKKPRQKGGDDAK